MNLDPWLDVLEQYLPWETADQLFEVDVIRDQCEASDGYLKACIRTINWYIDDVDGRRLIRDIKEQLVALGRVENLEHLERYDAFMRASTMAFQMIDEGVEFETFLPEDLFFPEVLDQKAQTVDDFGRSLSSKSRYGGIGSGS